VVWCLVCVALPLQTIPFGPCCPSQFRQSESKLTNDADLQLLASLPKECPVFRGCLDPAQQHPVKWELALSLMRSHTIAALRNFTPTRC
jgi:hypothetical protein